MCEGLYKSAGNCMVKNLTEKCHDEEREGNFFLMSVNILY